MEISKRKVLGLMAALIGLSACATDGVVDVPAVASSKAKTTPDANAKAEGVALLSGEAGNRAAKRFAMIGTGQLVGPIKTRKSLLQSDDGQGVTVNLVNVSVAEASKTILGDILAVNYTVSPRIDGHVTIQTSTPVTRAGLIELFQNALRSSGATINRVGDSYQVEGVDQAGRGPLSLAAGAESGPNDLGSGVHVVQLKYVSVGDMRRILEPIVPRGSVLASGESRNSLVLNGTPADIATMLDTIAVFDVDVMRGTSVVLVPVSSVQPEAIVDDLRAVFGADKEGPMSGMVRFLPNQRLKSILVMSSQKTYLERAEAMIHRLDAKAQGVEKQLYTYQVQNRSAKELVQVVESMFAGSSKDGHPVESVSPKYQQNEIQAGADRLSASASPFGNLGQGAGAGALSGAGGISSRSFGGMMSMDQPSSTGPTSTAMRQGEDERVKVTADDANNALLIMASPQDYKKALRIIQSIDVMPSQVMIEATIAEVSLTDDLQFGLKWYFQNKNMGGGLADAAAAGIGAGLPGFSYALAAKNVQVTLNALNAITKVNVVSSPSLTVLDNRTAVLQIGDQVPITTQSATSVLTTGAPVVNSVNYRDTGVILSITPRINQSGRILLNIEQEVSNVSSTTTSNIDSPTIKQRKVKTTVLVSDGETIALGGMIQDQSTLTKSQLPILGDVPTLGNLFGQKSNSFGKTELIVLITPKVSRNLAGAREITDEYRNRFDVAMPHRKGGERRFLDTVQKVLE